MSNESFTSRGIAKLLEKTVVHAFDILPVGIIKLFDNIQAQCLGKVSISEEILADGFLLLAGGV
jgi:hypothetical protein